jgi:asparagine synthase (glutamine-hydrolysing)
MCGVLLTPSTYLPEQIELALAAMSHRGDGEKGHVSAKNFAGWTFAHVRLAIQDRTEDANQPFEGRSSLYGFVGEFFNHQAGEQMHLLSALVDEAVFHNTDGFWAAASVTKYGATVYTDHLGIKPMYFWPKYRIFCSELEPMFMLQRRPAFDQTYLANCIKWGYDYSGRTPYEGIVQMRPGTRITVSDIGIHEETYWKWWMVPQAGYLRDAVTQAIENRLIGELPVALLLSGGLDSSIIYYTLKDILGREVDAFSVENGEGEFLPPEVTLLDNFSSFTRPPTMREAVRIMQAPLDLGSLVPQVQLAKAVSAAGYNVCLTGDGADEVFGGYRRAAEYDSQWSDVFCELPYYHLPRLDRVMMKETIELRSPYLAPAVIAHGLSLPREMRTQKQALKRAFKGVVPDRIINRAKHPLKTEAVKTGGIGYRIELVDAFISEVEQ